MVSKKTSKKTNRRRQDEVSNDMILWRAKERAKERVKERAKEDDDGRRLDRILRKSCPAAPLSALHRLLRKGAVRVNGKKATADLRVSAGDVIEFMMEGEVSPYAPVTPPHNPPAPSPILKILFESADVLALNKGAGVVVHGESSLESAVRGYVAGRIPQSLSFSPGPAHRLDRGTSGVILFSKSLAGARYISGGLREGVFRKTYLAIVEGTITGEEIWEDTLSRDSDAKKTIIGGGGGRAR
jgi:23S rRNA pseudouridine955/2504/2580 synthase